MAENRYIEPGPISSSGYYYSLKTIQINLNRLIIKMKENFVEELHFHFFQSILKMRKYLMMDTELTETKTFIILKTTIKCGLVRRISD